MRRVFRVHLELLVLCAFVLVSGYPLTVAAQPCDAPVARIVSVQGTVEASSADSGQWRSVSQGDTFCPGDTIRVLEKSRADVTLMDRSFLRINENTTITLEGVLEERTSLIDLLKGAAHFLSREPRGVEIKTQFAIFGVRGTEFLVRVEAELAFMSVFAGAVQAENAVGSLTLTGGQSTVARAGAAPVLATVARPRDAVQWALYYPPVMYHIPPDLIERDPATITDPLLLAQRAALLLDVGRVEVAAADLERALAIRPDLSEALALQAIIAIVRNEKEPALDLAQRAVDADPGSPTALIAMSYARQARFDLEGARAALKEAVGAAPDNALAWARLAEIQAAFGDLEKSLSAARKAESLAPDLALTQTILGFAYLTQIQLDEAKAAFEKAITLDQAAPLPRLGLGLAKIRGGDLDGGGREMEIAASLDPNNSLIRSYLGKTYYEEKRGPLDEREYGIAKELDPNDPTPWFYDAISKQTTNRPVEALHNLQKAIELNDNRFVYRSKLLLDSDLAARQSSLARIYDDLGFEQRALVEGWNALNSDPSNYSAHRFLADSYAALPRREIARVSELLQAQLLQPINVAPIQPRSAESDLLLISRQGPAAPSFNAYNPLFNRNQIALQASGLVGENSTWGGEGIASALHDNLSMSAGYQFFETDGWRRNAYEKDSVVNVFTQYEFSHKTSVQAEYRHRETEEGDLELRFDPDDFFPNQDQESRSDTIRFGARHVFYPGSILLGSLMYQEVATDIKNFTEQVSGLPAPFPPGLDLLIDVDTDVDVEESAIGGEALYIFRSEFVSSSSGGGYFDINGDEEIGGELSTIFPPPFSIFSSTEPLDDKVTLDANHTNLYHYFYINYPETVLFTLGASVDFFNSDLSDTEDRDQFNPKFGIVWNPFPGTTIRSAIFRTLTRTLVTEQTLEPTQVAGFNQFYDDTVSTESWVYGIALDQKITQNIYGGVEVSKRDLDVPAPIGESFATERVDWEEYFARTYLYWTPVPWAALSAEYLYEKFDFGDEFNFGAKEVTTQRVPLGINLFHSCGISLRLKGTFYDQYGEFLPLLDDPLPENFEDGDDQFWIFDLALRYRIPKRHGFISVGAANLFDQDFSYFETDFANPVIQPGRSIFATLSLVFP